MKLIIAARGLLIKTLLFVLLVCHANAIPYLLNAQQPNSKTQPQYIRDHYSQIESLTVFDGMVISSETGWNLMNGTARSYTQISNDFAPLVGLTFTRMKHNFAFVTVDRPADFFDDWSVTIENFRVLARVLKEKGFEGIFFDNEEYRRMLWNYPDNVSYTSKSLSQYYAQAQLRGQQIMQAMVGEFPSLVIMVAHGPYSSFSGTPDGVRYQQTDWIHDELRGPFSVGLILGLGASAKFVDGGEVYGYRTTTDFQNSYTFRKYTIASDSANCPFIPATLRPLWSSKVGISFGAYNYAYPYWVAGVTMDPTIMRTTLENALRRCDTYTWLYFENLDWNTAGGITSDWVNAVSGAKTAVGSISPTPTPTPTPTASPTPVPTTTASTFAASVNFQATGVTPPSGYVADIGSVYGSRGNGFTYGWNVSHVEDARNRGGSTDIRLATLCQFRTGGVWEIAVPNGTYNVTVGVGDGGYPSTYTINVEGVNYWNAASLSMGQFVNQTKAVTVSDGKLTINQGAGGWEATRINYVLVRPNIKAISIADSFVCDGGYAAMNFGTAGSMYARMSSTGYNYMSYLKFDISKFPTIKKATLSFGARLNTIGSVGTDIFAVPMTTWTETGITWNNRPAAGTRLESVIVSGTTIALYSKDMTDYVASEKALGHNTVSFLLKNLTVTGPITIVCPRESTIKPTLTITGM